MPLVRGFILLNYYMVCSEIVDNLNLNNVYYS